MKVGYVVFNATTGTILRYGECAENMVAAQASNAGEESIEGTILPGQSASVNLQTKTLVYS